MHFQDLGMRFRDRGMHLRIEAMRLLASGRLQATIPKALADAELADVERAWRRTLPLPGAAVGARRSFVRCCMHAARGTRCHATRVARTVRSGHRRRDAPRAHAAGMRTAPHRAWRGMHAGGSGT